MNKKDIKVGMYVRTKDGYIAKFINYGYNEGVEGKSCLFDKKIRDISTSVYDEDNFLFDDELKEYIKKYSYNLEDLIEDRDIVRYRVNSISTALKTRVYIDFINVVKDENYLVRLKKDYNIEILEILTKEQYSQNCYKVKKGGYLNG